MNVMYKIILVIILVAVAAGYLVFVIGGKIETIKGTPVQIGFIGPLSGEKEISMRGANIRSAVEVAVNKVNLMGGINGRPIEVIYKDGKCEQGAAATAASDLINLYKVPAILGGTCSHETLAFTEMAEQSGTVVLTYCSAAAEISDAGDYIFRNTPSTVHLARFAAKYLKKVENVERLAILYVNEPYGVSIMSELEDYFVNGGGTIVASESFERTDSDLSGQIAKIQAANPDALYFVSYSDKITEIMGQIREAKLAAPIFGGNEWDNPRLWSERVNDGVKYIAVSAEINESFKDTMRSRFGINEVLDCTPQAYDGLRILAKAIAEVGENPKDIKNELYNMVYTSDISSNKISFDENGDVLTATYLMKKITSGTALEIEYYRTDQYGDIIQDNIVYAE